MNFKIGDKIVVKNSTHLPIGISYFENKLIEITQLIENFSGQNKTAYTVKFGSNDGYSVIYPDEAEYFEKLENSTDSTNIQDAYSQPLNSYKTKGIKKWSDVFSSISNYSRSAMPLAAPDEISYSQEDLNNDDYGGPDCDCPSCRPAKRFKSNKAYKHPLTSIFL